MIEASTTIGAVTMTQAASAKEQTVARPGTGDRVRVLALTLDAHPSGRLRILQYVSALEANGIDVDCLPIPSGSPDAKTILQIRRALRGKDVVFVQRIAFMHLNLLLATSGLPIVYDLDDALHYIRRWQAPTARTPRTLKDRLRVRYRKTVRGSRYYGSRKHPIDVLIRLSKAVIVGNDYLRAELARDESSLVVLPTCVPVDPLRRKQHRDASPVRIGWIGTRGNLLELREIDVVFFELSKRFGDQVILSVVSSAPYETTSIRTEFVPWSVDDESDSILTFDVGIMPLADALFARGKCSLKAIQYMAHGIPAVVSPVGMNVEVVRHGRNGYLARSTDEWLESLSILVADTSVRAQLGRAAFETVRESYSSEYALGVLRSVFERCSQRQLPKRPAYIGSSPQKVA